jgi:hypothetical protein
MIAPFSAGCIPASSFGKCANSAGVDDLGGACKNPPLLSPFFRDNP